VECGKQRYIRYDIYAEQSNPKLLASPFGAKPSKFGDEGNRVL
jgi:hypothetical protein